METKTQLLMSVFFASMFAVISACGGGGRGNNTGEAEAENEAEGQGGIEAEAEAFPEPCFAGDLPCASDGPGGCKCDDIPYDANDYYGRGCWCSPECVNCWESCEEDDGDPLCEIECFRNCGSCGAGGCFVYVACYHVCGDECFADYTCADPCVEACKIDSPSQSQCYLGCETGCCSDCCEAEYYEECVASAVFINCDTACYATCLDTCRMCDDCRQACLHDCTVKVCGEECVACREEYHGCWGNC